MNTKIRDLVGMNINGDLALGENIVDFGLNVAYQAYELSQKAAGEDWLL